MKDFLFQKRDMIKKSILFPSKLPVLLSNTSFPQKMAEKPHGT
jgi:hypothetical protein